MGKQVNGELESGFIYQDQLNPVAELDETGTVVSLFIYATRANVPDYIFSRKENGTDWSNYRVVSDHLGSPRLVVDTVTGVIVQELDYDEFGRVLNNNTNPTFQPFGFAGGLYEPQTGLVRFGARDYEPEAGRWTAKDSILLDTDTTNLYQYSIADPVNMIDTEGKDGVPSWVVTMPLWDGPEIGPADIAAAIIALACIATTGEHWADDLIKKAKGERNWEKGRGDDPLWDLSADQLKSIEDSPLLPPDLRKRAKKIRKIKQKKAKGRQ